MDNEANVLEYFKEELEAASKSERDAILMEVDGVILEAIKEYEQSARVEADYAYRRKIQEENSVLAKQMAALSADKNNRINAVRKEIEDSVFAQAKEKLCAYAKTPEYERQLLEKIKEVCACMDHQGAVLYMASKDVDIIKKSVADVKMVVSDDITIGGFIMENKAAGIIVDESYDSLLEEQRDWFYQNSGLIIK